jgi:hypothetical protein
MPEARSYATTLSLQTCDGEEESLLLKRVEEQRRREMREKEVHLCGDVIL